jgi:hypothetical protein
MGRIARAVAARQRHRDALDAERRLAAGRTLFGGWSVPASLRVLVDRTARMVATGIALTIRTIQPWRRVEYPMSNELLRKEGWLSDELDLPLGDA